jgi:signal transduction histidine kinase
MIEQNRSEANQTKATIEAILGLLIHELNGSAGVGITGSSFIADITLELSQQVSAGSISTEDLSNRLKEIHEVSEAMQLSLMNHSDTIFVARDRLFSLCDTPVVPNSPNEILNGCWNQLVDQLNQQPECILENRINPNLVIHARSGVLETICTQLIQNTLSQGASIIEPSKNIIFEADSIVDSLSDSFINPDTPNQAAHEDSNGSVVMILKDNGPGVELDSMLVHPSKPQFLYKNMPRPRLGLSIVHRLVTRYLQGSVHFDSIPHQGFSTRITLTQNIDSKQPDGSF